MREKYEAASEFDENGEREVKFSTKNPPEDWSVLKAKGWRLPAAPRKKLTHYQRFNQLILKKFNNLFDSVEDLKVMSWLKSALPRMKIMSFVYNSIVDSTVWKQLDDSVKQSIIEAGRGDVNEIIEQFKDYKAANKSAYKQFVDEHFTDFVGMLEESSEELIQRILDDLALATIYEQAAAHNYYDEEIKNFDDGEKAEFKRFKREIKQELSEGIDKLKVLYIKEFYDLA